MRRHRTRPADNTARLPQNPANFDALARTQHEGTLGNNYLQIRTRSTSGSAIAEEVPSCSGVSRASSTREREKEVDRKSKLGPDAIATG